MYEELKTETGASPYEQQCDDQMQISAKVSIFQDVAVSSAWRATAKTDEVVYWRFCMIR
jgi:hypothetical protein